MDVIDLTGEDSPPTATIAPIDLTRESDDFSDAHFPSILEEVQRNNPKLRLVGLVNIINSSTNAHDFVQKLKVDDEDFSITNLASLKKCCPNKRVGAVTLAVVLQISATRTITVGIVKAVVQEVGRCTFSIGDVAGIPNIISRINNKLSSTLVPEEVLELAKQLDTYLPSWILETNKWILEGLMRPQLVAMMRLWLKRSPDAFGNDLAEVKAIVDSLPYSQANLKTVLDSINSAFDSNNSDSAFDSNNSKTTTPPSAEVNTEQLLEEAISLLVRRQQWGKALGSRTNTEHVNNSIARHTEELTRKDTQLSLEAALVQAKDLAEGEAKSRWEGQSNNGKANGEVNGLLTEEDHFNKSVDRHTKDLMSKDTQLSFAAAVVKATALAEEEAESRFEKQSEGGKTNEGNIFIKTSPEERTADQKHVNELQRKSYNQQEVTREKRKVSNSKRTGENAPQLKCIVCDEMVGLFANKKRKGVKKNTAAKRHLQDKHPEYLESLTKDKHYEFEFFEKSKGGW